jgi:hypothetical protein
MTRISLHPKSFKRRIAYPPEMFRMRLENLCALVHPKRQTFHLRQQPHGFTANFHMQFSNLILIASLLVATETAFAADPDAGIPVLGTVIESDHLYPWEKQRIRATETVESGASLNAFKYLQD